MSNTKIVKLLSTAIILLLYGCKKVNALSPYTMKYIDGEPQYYMLDSVQFTVPSNIDFLNWCIPGNDTVVNWDKIRVYAYGRQQENIQYMNSDGFDPDFLCIMAKNNYVINKKDISELIKYKRGVLLSHFFTDKRNEVPFTYSKLEKDDLIIGESLFYTSYNEAVFTSPYIEYKLNFVIDEYLIQLGVVFSNSKSTEICTQLPQFFTKQNSEFTWKTEHSREEFMTYIFTADRNKLPAIIKDFLDIVESINKTLVIKE